MEHGEQGVRSLLSILSRGGRPVLPMYRPFEISLKFFTFMLLAGVLLVGGVSGSAKDRRPTTRTISGTVYDDAQNTIPGASIELTDTQTGKVLDIYSQEAGEYQFTGLRFDHDYTVRAEYKGVSSETRKISILETRWTLVLNLTIERPKK